MTRKTCIWVFYLLFVVLAWSPAISQQAKSSQATAKTQTPAQLLDVLFATNDDCELYVDDDFKGTVSKNEFRYLKLAPGKYRYTAKSKATLDELKDSFTVAANLPNEIFMDLLWVVDEKTAARESLKQQLAWQPLVQDEKLMTGAVTQVMKTFNAKDLELSIINALIGNMVLIKAGSFIMGNNKAPFTDEVEHPVSIEPVLFSKYEVTQHQWESMMGYNPSIYKECATCPVENVSWEEAMRFIRKLNVISGRKFRLPTEAEWEYVARIGGKTEIDTSGGPEAYIRKTAWYFANADKRTHPVGSKLPNVAGIYDLTGNVSEWCFDWYGAYYYKEDFNQLSPEGPPLGKEKIIRGGNLKDYQGDSFRPSLRRKRPPMEKSSEVGFRLVLELER